jgi:hypothetical protein
MTTKDQKLGNKMRSIFEIILMLVVATWVLGTATFADGQELGIKARKPVLGAACKVCPWGALANIVKEAMQPYGYDIQICYHCFRADARVLQRICGASR